MKKVILLLIICLGFVSLQAQTILPAQKYVYSYVGVAADTVGVSDTIWRKSIQLNKLNGLYYNANLKVSDVAAGATATIKLKGKVFGTDEYTDISTVLWKGGGTDTIVTFTSNANKIYYRYLQFEVKRTASKAKISFINLSLKK